ncbi:MAG: hypothetical protein ABSG81_04130 [Acidimicrobiales bacterium]|jgi:hypothetical protein
MSATGALTLREGVKGPRPGADNQGVPSAESGPGGLLARLPLTATSLLVAGVTVVAVVLVTAMVLTPPGGGSPVSSQAATDWRTPVLLPHTTVPGVAPITTAPEAAGTGATTAPPTTGATSSATSPPTTVRPSAPPSAGSAAPASRLILPPRNPAADIAAAPAFSGLCEQDGFDAAPCISAATQALSAARADEGLGPVTLPSDFASLSAGEQLFVLSDIERVDRGLPPVVGMVDALDQDAQAGADGDTDATPSSLPPGSSVSRWGSNWAEAAGPLGSMYAWMYEDGPGSGNADCTAADGAGCWGHRDNVLGFDAAQISGGVLVMGAAQATGPGDGPWTSDAELIAVITGSPSFTYTWAQAQAAGAR